MDPREQRSIPMSLNDLLSLLPAMRHSPEGQLRASYDEESDVLYVHFGPHPKPATDSELTEDDNIVRCHGEEVVGVAMLHASRR